MADKIAELSRKKMSEATLLLMQESDRIDLPDIISNCKLGKPICDKEYTEEVEYVDINLISCSPCSKDKLERNETKIQSLKTVLPIDYNKLHKNGNKFTLSDGNHRVYVCKKLGYSHYPFIKIQYSDSE